MPMKDTVAAKAIAHTAFGWRAASRRVGAEGLDAAGVGGVRGVVVGAEASRTEEVIRVPSGNGGGSAGRPTGRAAGGSGGRRAGPPTGPGGSVVVGLDQAGEDLRGTVERRHILRRQVLEQTAHPEGQLRAPGAQLRHSLRGGRDER